MTVCYENKNIEVVFLSSNATSLFQPHWPGRPSFWLYTVLENIYDCGYNNIKVAVNELKPETVNACWKNTWSDIVNDVKCFPKIDKEIKKITDTARVGGEGFVNMLVEVKAQIEGYREVLTDEELEELRLVIYWWRWRN